MLRALISRTTVAVECAPIVNSMAVQIRWRRKPRWLGTAKTKVFRVPERKKQDPEEYALLFEWHSRYRTKMKAIQQFLKAEAERKANEVNVLHKSPEQIQAEWDSCFALNEAWNVEVAKVRAVRLEHDAIKTREYVLEKLAAKEEREQTRLAKAREIILHEKSQVDTFITPENIDKAIEHALANITDFNFAIDMDGNMYRGREGNTPEPVTNAKSLTS